MNLGILTCQKLPQGVQEDQPLLEALTQQGINHQMCIWDQKHDWTQFDALLIRSVWDYHERQAEFLAWCTERSQETTLINPYPVIQWNSNKKYLKTLAKAGLPVAPTVWLSDGDAIDLEAACQSLGGHRWFLKPVVGADSSGTLRFRTSEVEAANEHLSYWLPQVDMMLQPYLETVESQGEVSLIYFGTTFSHAVIKKPVTGDYRVQNTFGASDHAYTPSKQEHETADQVMDFLTRQFENILYTRIDFLFDTSGHPMVNEVELIEPSLFLHHHKSAPKLLIQQLKAATVSKTELI